MQWQQIYDLGGLNQSIFYAVNSIQFPGWETLMMSGTRLGNFYTAFGMYMAVALLILLWRNHLLRGTRESMASSVELGRVLLALTVVACSHVISQEISETIKTLVPMPRPYVALPEDTVHKLDTWLTAKNDYQSFPSGHAAFTAVLLWGFWPLMSRKLRIVAGIMAVWVITSRMALGVHFPSDLLAGFLQGSVTVLILRQVLKRLTNPALSFPRIN